MLVITKLFCKKHMNTYMSLTLRGEKAFNFNFDGKKREVMMYEITNHNMFTFCEICFVK